MVEVAGVYNHREFETAQRSAARRLFGGVVAARIAAYFLLYGGLIVVAVGLLGLPLEGGLKAAVTGAGVLLYLTAGLWACRRFLRSRIDRVLARIGYPMASQVSYRVGDQALTLSADGCETRIGWSVLIQILETRSHWVFLSAGPTIYLPRRFFADRGAERVFLAAALGYANPAALNRSPEARKFASSALEAS
ncbi:YcxB family protein [Phenylobacterium sp.]|uniref:YcxB family protein n=1 Tax=Phenylobacterium sp. TaxID=1871053 RepID=UPI003564B769